MRFYLYFLIVFTVLSCDNEIVETYKNGNIKKKYYINDGVLDGIYKEYYENENIKEISRYIRGIKVDTAKYFYKIPKGRIKKFEFHLNKDTVSVVSFSKKGIELRKGLINKGNRIGKWSIFREDGTLSEVLEYINFNNNEFLNQGWHFNKEGDTIIGKGNYLEFKLSKDTINVFEPVEILVFLKQPLLSYDSEVFVCISKDSLDEVKKDFSNFNQIKWDTLPSIKNEKIISNFEKYNLFVSFGIEFENPGEKHIRGFLSENRKISPNNDNYDMEERKIYFDKKIYVKDH